MSQTPKGWKLVPIEPTDAMVEAGRIARMNIAGGYDGPSGWQAMLDAAPPAPAEHVVGVEAAWHRYTHGGKPSIWGREVFEAGFRAASAPAPAEHVMVTDAMVASARAAYSKATGSHHMGDWIDSALRASLEAALANVEGE